MCVYVCVRVCVGACARCMYGFVLYVCGVCVCVYVCVCMRVCGDGVCGDGVCVCGGMSVVMGVYMVLVHVCVFP